MPNNERASGRSLKLSIPELRQQLFEDFSLESSRTKPLTVLGEDAYGTRQGRIVTKPIPAEAEGGGGAPAEPEPPRPTCVSPYLWIYEIAPVLLGKCGFYPVTGNHASTGGGTTYAAYTDAYVWDGPAGHYYLTKTLVFSGADPGAVDGNCPDAEDGVGAGTLTRIDTLGHPLCPELGTEYDGSIVYETHTVAVEEDFDNHSCVSVDQSYSDEYTEPMLWADIDAIVGTPGVPADSGGLLELTVHQQFFTQENSSEPENDGYAEIEISRANWRAYVPESYTGDYMKVWLWKETLNYDNNGDFTGSTDAFYAAYEWDLATSPDRFFNPSELLAVPTIENTNQRIRIYIKKYTCVRGVDCEATPANPDCLDAGAF